MAKKNITVSIMPTYKCRNHCPYCYLPTPYRYCGDNMLYYPYLGYIRKVEEKLRQIAREYLISTIEIYGGDLSLLPQQFLADLNTLCHKFSLEVKYTWDNVESAKELGIKVNQLNISINPERRDFAKNLEIIKKFPQTNAITVVTSRVIQTPTQEIMRWFNRYMGPRVTLMPLSNIGGSSYITNYEYCNFVIRMLNEPTGGALFTNEIKIIDAIRGRYSPAMENNIFINPEGAYCCVEWDDMGQEFFREFSTLQEWQERCLQEVLERKQYCGTCEYYMYCMAEHFKRPDQYPEQHYKLKDTCNGYKPLIKWGIEHGFSC